MRSQLQIEASRLNSQKSTGPRSEAGKSISSQNYILKTGIYANSEIIRGENPADLAALADDYYHRFQPAAPELRALVDTLVHSEWTLRRLRRAEAQLWERNISITERKGEPNPQPLGRAVNYDESKVFARLQRRIDATQRNFERALKQLDQLKLRQPAEVAQELGQEVGQALSPGNPEPPSPAPLGFAPSTPESAPNPCAATTPPLPIEPAHALPPDEAARIA